MSVPAEGTSRADAVRLPVPPAARARRRRRPSGEPPPLPRQLNRSGKFWLVVAGAAVLFCALLVPSGGLTLRLDEIEGPVLSGLSALRLDPLTTFFRGLDAAIGPVVLGVWWGSLLVMLIWRRWRHLFVWIGTMWLVSNLTDVANQVIQRPRPLTVEIVGAWQGFGMPSRPVAVLAATAVNVLYALVPAGRARGRGKLIAAGLVGLVCAGRLYLAVDHPTDILAGVALGVAIPLAGWRLLVPNDVFPVTYRRRRTAHLDVSGHRGEAILRALHDQLGVMVTAVKPFGLEGSGGSTPLRLTVKGDPETYLFGKLYAITHLRSDRWYKLGRTLLYGRLEDEKPFNTVRRLVQYEDYVLRLMHSASLPVPEPYGFVEITPEREYLLVTEFLADAKEVGDVEVDEGLIDQGLQIVRQLWEAGLAHRDIKPANLMVRDGRLMLIDSAFAEIRPSPWRQAVDLGNMMLVLALRSDARTVYDRARLHFSDSEIAEAFAATTRGLTMPSQLRRMIREHGRDLHAEFIRLLPERLPPIRIQRWTVRRVGLLAGVVVLAALASQLVIALLRSPL